MKHKKEFFGVLISVLVCVFLVYLAVYATTVGTNITATGDITVSGNDITFGGGAVLSNQDADWLTLTEANVSVSADFAVTSGARIGAGSSGTHFTALANDSLFVEGQMEVDGTVWFDNGASISNDLIIGTDDISFLDGGAASLSSTLWVGGAGTLNSTLTVAGKGTFSAGASISNDLIIGSDDVSFLDGGAASLSSTLWVGGLATFAAAASVSAGDFSVEAGNFSVDGTASVSGGFQIGGGSNLFGGTASPTGATYSCAAGDIYIRGGGGIDTLIARCEATNSWDYLDLTDK